MRKASAVLEKTKFLPVRDGANWTEIEKKNGKVIVRACAISALALETLPRNAVKSVDGVLVTINNNEQSLENIAMEKYNLSYDIANKVSSEFISSLGRYTYEDGSLKGKRITRRNVFAPVVEYLKSVGH